MVKPGAKIPFDSALPQSAEQSVGLVLPAVLSDRLDSLVALAERNGERTNRREVVAALLLAAKPSGAAISELIRAYRRAQVQEALVGDAAGEEYVVGLRRPGPRPRFDRRS